VARIRRRVRLPAIRLLRHHSDDRTILFNEGSSPYETVSSCHRPLQRRRKELQHFHAETGDSGSAPAQVEVALVLLNDRCSRPCIVCAGRLPNVQCSRRSAPRGSCFLACRHSRRLLQPAIWPRCSDMQAIAVDRLRPRRLNWARRPDTAWAVDPLPRRLRGPRRSCRTRDLCRSHLLLPRGGCA
jgi:hypothetical protein